MFQSQTRLFKGIECPSIKQKKKCELPHCIFSHPRAAAAPAVKRVKETPAKAAPPPKRKVVFSPVMLDHPPAQHQLRLRYLSVIRDKLEEVKCNDPEAKAMELEKQTAERSTAGTYANNIRTLVREILRGEHNEGAEEAREKQAAKSTRLKYREELAKLIIPESKLSKRYIIEIPSGEVEEDNKPVKCDRCGAMFYPTEEAPVECHFHLLRRNYNLEKKKLEDVFPCCGQVLGESNGCELRSTHVFKLSAPSELHKAIPFRTVPDTPASSKWLFGVAIDCEMAYTSKGMELIRVTALDWDSGDVVLDRTVFPSGRVLDLNTRFSGVSDLNEGTTLNSVHYPTLDFESALTALFEYVGPHTIIIGHGLENDLQTLRLVHNLVVDTAMLYPRHATRTHSLKQLAWTFLSRNIQSGEHDSYEDAGAAMDIVKADIRSRLKLDK